jgi:hypothetical protein
MAQPRMTDRTVQPVRAVCVRTRAHTAHTALTIQSAPFAPYAYRESPRTLNGAHCLVCAPTTPGGGAGASAPAPERPLPLPPRRRSAWASAGVEPMTLRTSRVGAAPDQDARSNALQRVALHCRYRTKGIA